MPWREEPIGRHHNRSAFDCGVPALNDYLQRYARQNHTTGGAKTFVAVSPDNPSGVLGYYSLSPAELQFDSAPDTLTRGLGRYPIPGFRLARLAVSRTHQGQGLGGQLLLAAGERCLAAAAKVGGVIILIDAKTSAVGDWYQGYGAIPLQDNPLQLVLTLATVATALQNRKP